MADEHGGSAALEGLMKIVVAVGPSIVGAYMTSAHNHHADQMLMIWGLVVAVTIAGYALVSFSFSRRRDRYVTLAQHEEVLDGIDVLTQAVKTIMRAQLINDHDRLMRFGSASSAQKSSYQAEYELYRETCRRTNDGNGLIDQYDKDVLGLPLHEGREG